MRGDIEIPPPRPLPKAYNRNPSFLRIPTNTQLMIFFACRYQWVVPCRAQQDCVVDQKLEHKSELLALTSALECHWYSVSESKRPSSTGREEILREMIRIERLAVLKKVELCTKLRKLDFREFLVAPLGVEYYK